MRMNAPNPIDVTWLDLHEKSCDCVTKRYWFAAYQILCTIQVMLVWPKNSFVFLWICCICGHLMFSSQKFLHLPRSWVKSTNLSELNLLREGVKVCWGRRRERETTLDTTIYIPQEVEGFSLPPIHPNAWILVLHSYGQRSFAVDCNGLKPVYTFHMKGKCQAIDLANQGLFATVTCRWKNRENMWEPFGALFASRRICQR